MWVSGGSDDDGGGDMGRDSTVNITHVSFYFHRDDVRVLWKFLVTASNIHLATFPVVEDFYTEGDAGPDLLLIYNHLPASCVPAWKVGKFYTDR